MRDTIHTRRHGHVVPTMSGISISRPCRHRHGLLGTVVALRITPMLAILLVGGSRHRPLLPMRWWALRRSGNNPTSLSYSVLPRKRHCQHKRTTPKYIICDKGPQFWCDAFKAWCDDQGTTPRFGAVGQHGSIALIERFILSLKNGCTRIILVPLRTDAFHQELTSFSNWHNQNRPHSSLNGKTPNEVYHDVWPACERPRYEPRARWPRSAPSASPHAPVAGHCGTPIRVLST